MAFTCQKCHKSFKNEHGLQIHSYRMHKSSGMVPKNMVVPQKKSSPDDMANVMHNILSKAPDNTVPLRFLIEELQQAGLSAKTYKSFAQRIYRVTRTDQRFGRAGRGMIHLKNDLATTQRSTNQINDQNDNISALPLDAQLILASFENARLTKQLRRTQELAIGLGRLIGGFCISEE